MYRSVHCDKGNRFFSPSARAPSPDDISCDNGQACDGAETCKVGVGCANNPPADADDGIDCTLDTCNDATGDIEHVAQHAACSDGVFCHGAEICDPASGCKAGDLPVLDDGVSCTIDSCDEDLNQVVHASNNDLCDATDVVCYITICAPEVGGCADVPAQDGLSCDDDKPCTKSESCQFGTCISGGIVDCDDLQYCNGQEYCAEGQGCMPGNAPKVDDGVDCTLDFCDEESNTIKHSVQDANCNDGLYCNGPEVCDSQEGCKAGYLVCIQDSCGPEWDACTSNPNCNTVLECFLECGVWGSDDNEACQDACKDALAPLGAQYLDLLGECVAQGCSPVNINDGVKCTIDKCDEDNNTVTHTPNDSWCDNGQACDGAEQCKINVGCVNNPPPNADDGFDCTLDTCNDLTGEIEHIPQDAACSDGAFCNGSEICDVNVGCKAGTPPDVDDGIDCTVDGCSELLDKVIHTVDDVECDDADACTGFETCDAQEGCQPGVPIEVDDGDDCTIDTCQDGVVSHAPSNTPECNPGLHAGSPSMHDWLGAWVAVDGDTLVTGFKDDSCSTGVNGDETDDACLQSGGALVFRNVAGVWEQEAFLKASNAEAGDQFGFSGLNETPVAISGDRIVIGASAEKSCATGVGGDQADNGCFGAGAAYVFHRENGTWTQEAYLKPGPKFFPSVRYFGRSVAIDDDVIVVGARTSYATVKQSGAAYTFRLGANGWQLEAELAPPSEDLGDLFGTSVDVSGDRIVVGASQEDSAAVDVDGDPKDNSLEKVGAAYVFKWTGLDWDLEAYLKPSNSYNVPFGLRFGQVVTIDGDLVVVTTIYDNSCGKGVDADDTPSDCGGSGAVHVFKRSDIAGWTKHSFIKAPDVAEAPSAAFGLCARLHDNSLLVSSPYPPNSAVVFELNNADTWQQSALIQEPEGLPGTSYFGAGCDMTDAWIAVGAKNSTVDGVPLAGVVFPFPK